MGRVRVLRLLFTLVLGLRLHLVCTLQGLPVAFALTGAKADEREVLLAMFTAEPDRPARGASSPCARSSNQSTTLSKDNSSSNDAAGTPRGNLRVLQRTWP